MTLKIAIRQNNSRQADLSGQTITTDNFKGFKIFKKVFPDLPYGQLVIYAGDKSRDRTDFKVININGFSQVLETIDP